MEIALWVSITLASTVAAFALLLATIKAIESKFGATVGPATEVAATLAVALAALIGAGIYLPWSINSANNARQAQTTCFGSVIALRTEVAKVKFGMDVAPQEADQRVYDWSNLAMELENTRFGCLRAQLRDDASVEHLTRFLTDHSAAKEKAERNNPDKAYLKNIEVWSVAALKQLPR
ncbi:hypothetical protein [Nocardia rhizosphaerae]|uniref:DUF4760 domain-containing protein n=1 Tax=Nocardia rhizosphaerae TaxID=1691571 RepID=A0ABV8L7E9_9NOCA